MLVTTILLFLACSIFVGYVFSRLTDGKTPSKPYTRQSFFIQPEQLQLMSRIESRLDDRYVLMANVCLADVLKTRKGIPDKISKKLTSKLCEVKLDFIIVERINGKCRGVVDSSHMDNHTRSLLESAKLPVINLDEEKEQGKASSSGFTLGSLMVGAN